MTSVDFKERKPYRDLNSTRGESNHYDDYRQLRTTRGEDPITEARRRLPSSSRTIEDLQAKTARAVEDARRQLNMMSTRAPRDPVEDARRQLIGSNATRAPGDFDPVLSARRHLNALSSTRAPREEDPVESARRQLSGMRVTGHVGGACLHQEAAVDDLRRLHAAGGLQNNVVGDTVRITNGPHESYVPLSLMSKMIDHATNGCSAGDPDIAPCMNCAHKF